MHIIPNNDFKFRCISCGNYAVDDSACQLAEKLGLSKGNCSNCLTSGKAKNAINVAFPVER